MGSRLSLPEHETPSEIGQGLADWVVRRGSDRILDPAMGSGALLRAVLSRYESLGIRRGQSRIYGIEIDPRRVRVAAKALGGLTKSGPHLFVGDFLLDGFAIDGSKASTESSATPRFFDGKKSHRRTENH